VDSGPEGLYWGVGQGRSRGRFSKPAAGFVRCNRGVSGAGCRCAGVIRGGFPRLPACPAGARAVTARPGYERDRSVIMTSSTFDVVAKVISDTSEIPVDQITPEAHAIDDLGIDSLDFLDIVFALDKKFGIKIPLERWTEEVNQGKAAPEDYFVLKNLVARIDELVAAKSA
jgi:acyl carrier protein